MSGVGFGRREEARMTITLVRLVMSCILMALPCMVNADPGGNQPDPANHDDTDATFKRAVKEWTELSRYMRERTRALVDRTAEFRVQIKQREEELQELHAEVAGIEERLERQRDLERLILEHLQETLDREDERRKLIRQLLNMDDTRPDEQRSAANSVLVTAKVTTHRKLGAGSIEPGGGLYLYRTDFAVVTPTDLAGTILMMEALVDDPAMSANAVVTVRIPPAMPQAARTARKSCRIERSQIVSKTGPDPH